MPTLNINGNIRTNTEAGWGADATVYSAKTILISTDAVYGATDQRKFKIADGVQTWSQLDYFPVSGYDDATSSIQTQINGKSFCELNFGSGAVSSPIDGATVYTGLAITLSPNNTASARQFKGIDKTISGCFLFIDPTGTLGSSEVVTFSLYNVTDALVVGALGTITFTERGITSLNTSLNITMDSSKYYSVQIEYPTFATNPTNVIIYGLLLLK